jgi:hypothetical protein
VRVQWQAIYSEGFVCEGLLNRLLAKMATKMMAVPR